ncbi:MAG: SDR family NAD(P)-dependent oxidoreductase [Burkholderiaceae bacterium]|nr:SDR family NAD(P)-dependent oxidoreductase [Burkholderiaceae bacterium]
MLLTSSTDTGATPAAIGPSHGARHLTILTGGSRGMGLAMALQLMSADRLLLCISRQRNESLDAEAQAIGARVEQWSFDLSEASEAAMQLASWLAAPAADTYATATLINNAGVVPRITPLADARSEDIALGLRVGLEAPMLLTAAFLSATAGWVGERRVLNISSGLGRRAMASQGPYCAAKAGMDHFTRCLALEEAARHNGARVCSLAPGVIDTDMQTHLRSADPGTFADQQGFARMKTEGQLTSPDDAARRVLAFLARPAFGKEPVADVRAG